MLIINLWWTGQSSKILHHVEGGSSLCKGPETKNRVASSCVPATHSQKLQMYYYTRSSQILHKTLQLQVPKHGCDHCGNILKCMIVKT